MSVKTAVPDHPILDLLAERWSPRAFADRKVEPEKLRSLFEAARWAASSFNGQPWSFFVSANDDTEGFGKLAECLSPGNAWAKKAPVLGLSVATLNFENNNAPNRWALHDVGLAMGNLLAQATSMGIYLHQMAGFNADTASQVLAIPDGYAPVAMFAIGYLGDPAMLPEDLQKREAALRQRKPLAQFVFSGKWGNVAEILGG